MKINKPMLTVALRSMLVTGAIAAAVLVLTAPAHAKAIGETRTHNGIVTVFDDPCPGATANWFFAESSSAKDGVAFGCWTVESTSQLRIVWPMQTPDGKSSMVPILYNINGFYQPRTL